MKKEGETILNKLIQGGLFFCFQMSYFVGVRRKTGYCELGVFLPHTARLLLLAVTNLECFCTIKIWWQHGADSPCTNSAVRGRKRCIEIMRLSLDYLRP